MLIPVTLLPKFLEYISYGILPTWISIGIYSSLGEITHFPVFIIQLISIVLSILYILISLKICKVIEYRIKVQSKPLT